MKLIPIVAGLVMAAAAAGCDRHPQNATAYNNSGRTAAGGVSNTPSAGVTVADEQTSRKILTEIASNSGMKETDVNVTTTNGVVKLAGNARSRDQVALAMDIAKRQPGVATVESEIKVE